jgi:Xaa-Pro dipeptidase
VVNDVASSLTGLYLDHIAELSRGYEALLPASGLDALVIHSGLPLSRTSFDDQFWPLRVTPHFQHWLPLAEADCALIIRAGDKPKLLWNKQTSVWEKPAEPERHWQNAFEILETRSAEEAKAALPVSGRTAFIGDAVERARSWGFADASVNPKELVQRLDQLRTRKTAYEVHCLDQANQRAALGHRALHEAFLAGDASELDLHLLFLRATGQDDPETPYKNIVALGASAATLHHVSYRKTPTRGEGSHTLLVDAGATYLGYCSDITRTYVKGSGAATSAFANLVARVEAFQQKLCREVAIGRPYEQLHDQAHREVAAALREAGVIRLSVEEAAASGITRAFFPHGLGHSLGLQCHDVGCALIKPRPDNPFLRNTTLIGEGQCFTIEPGIYFIDALLAPLRQGLHAASIDFALVAELAQLGGVRIEDDLVVVGGERVTRNLTREVLP